MDWRTSVSTIRRGNAGNRQTIAAMSRLAQEGSIDPVVVRAAQQAVRSGPERSPDSDFELILADVRRRMRYTHDPLGAEVVKAPRFVIDATNESHYPEPMDCDDASTLASAMLAGIGYESKFVTVAVDRGRPNEWSHVYVAARHPAGHWVPLDPIVREFAAGDEVPAGQLTAPRAYHEGVDPMMRGMGCPATTGVHNGMTGLGYASRGMGETYDDAGNLVTYGGDPWKNVPGGRPNVGAPSSADSDIERYADKVLAAGSGFFSANAKTAQANAAARIAEANARARRGLVASSPGFFSNPDGSTNMTKVILVAGAVGIGGLLLAKMFRGRR